MTTAGHVQTIWRYPVKSMQGDHLDSCEVTVNGIVGDRAWAVRDDVRAEVQWGKRLPQLMQCHAQYLREPRVDDRTTEVQITFPDGEKLGNKDPRMDAKLTALCNIKASLWPLQPATDVKFYKRYKPDEAQWQEEIAQVFAREPGEPTPDLSLLPEVLIDHVAVPGTFFDNEAIHLMTTNSLSYMAQLNGAANWDVRRFRPNFLIACDDEPAGLIENDWVGKRLYVGEVELEISAPTVRCNMTTRAHGELDFDKTILRTVVREANQCLGVGAHVRRGGTLTVGAEIRVVG